MIHIYFRSSSNKKMTNRPEWFSFEDSWKNLIDTKQDSQVTVIYDGDIENAQVPFDEANSVIQIDSQAILPSLVTDWENNNDHYVDRDEAGNKYEKRTEKPDLEKASGYLMYECIYSNIDDLPDNDIIYIVEDDYMHLYGWPLVVENLYELYDGVNYFSLYDHPDKYSQRYTGLQANIFISNYLHWRTIPSTCGTFGGRVKHFKEDKAIHHYNLGDHNKFIHLQNKKRNMVSPMPAMATHCVEPWISPFRDWANI